MPVDNTVQDNTDEEVLICTSCEEEFNPHERDHHENNDGEIFCYDCYWEYYQHCGSCGSEVESDYIMWSDRDEEYYCDNCYRGEGEDVDLESHRLIFRTSMKY